MSPSEYISVYLWISYIASAHPVITNQHNISVTKQRRHEQPFNRAPRSTCSSVQYYNRTLDSCADCERCASGHYASKPCGHGEGGLAKCLPCTARHFSRGGTNTICNECRNCTEQKRATTLKCRFHEDTVCGACLPGHEPLYPEAVEETLYPCHNPTAGTGASSSVGSADSEATPWKIVAIFFIVAFCLISCIVIYLCYKKRQKPQAPRDQQETTGPPASQNGHHQSHHQGPESERLLKAQPPGSPSVENTEVDDVMSLSPVIPEAGRNNRTRVNHDPDNDPTNPSSPRDDSHRDGVNADSNYSSNIGSDDSTQSPGTSTPSRASEATRPGLDLTVVNNFFPATYDHHPDNSTPSTTEPVPETGAADLQYPRQESNEF